MSKHKRKIILALWPIILVPVALLVARLAQVQV